MEAYADPLKFYPPDPANETDPKEKMRFTLSTQNCSGKAHFVNI